MYIKKIIIPLLLIIVIGLSYIFNFIPGQKIGVSFFDFTKSMLSFLPAVFILIGLFDVWIKKEVIVAHMGEKSGIKGLFWAILLSGTTVGGLYVAFPMAYSLHQKGARLGVIFTFIGAAAVARIPMAMYESSYVGLKFTLIRIGISLPLVVVSALLFELFLNKTGYEIKQPENIKVKKGNVKEV